MAMWRDVMGLCQRAAKECTFKDPMITIEDFSLLDAMSAVELMDPKMDQCYGVTCSIRIEDLLRAKFPEPFTLSTILKILQSLIVHETSFLDGASYLESTHQCVFMWEGSWASVATREQGLAERVLLSFVKSLDRSLASVNQIVMTSDIHEDEDFQVTHKQVLSMNLGHEEALTGVDAVSLELLLRLNGDQQQSPLSEEDRQVLPKIMALVIFRSKLQSFYAAMDKWSSASVRGATRVRTRVADSLDHGQLSLLCAETKAASEGVANALEGLMNIFEFPPQHATTAAVSSSASAGGSAPVSVVDTPTSVPVLGDGDMGSHKDHPDIDFAYNEVLVKVMQSSAIRSIKLKPFSSCLKHLQGITNQVYKICVIYSDLSTAHDKGKLDFEDLLQISMHLSADRLHLLSRSLYLGALYSWMPAMSDLVVMSMRRRGLPGDILGDEDEEGRLLGSRVQSEWVQLSVSRTAWDTLRALMVNRNRLLGKIGGLLVSWGGILDEAEYLDMENRQKRWQLKTGAKANEAGGEPQDETKEYCVTWIMLSTTLLMDLQMCLMVENELLGKEELAYFYWYWDFICTSRAWAIDKLRNYRFIRENAAQEKYLLGRAKKEIEANGVTGGDKGPAGANNTKKSKQKNKNNAAVAVVVAGEEKLTPPGPISEPVISIEEIVVRSRGHACRGLFRMFALAHELSLVRRHDERYTSLAYKFHQRFAAFHPLRQPHPVSYRDYLRSVNAAVGLNVRNMSFTSSSSSTAADDSAEGTEDNGDDDDDMQEMGDVDCMPIVECASICFTNARKYTDEIKKLMPGSPPEGDDLLAIVEAVTASTASTLAGPHQTMLCYRRVSDLIAHRTVLSLTKTMIASTVNALKLSQLLKSKIASVEGTKQGNLPNPPTALTPGTLHSNSTTTQPPTTIAAAGPSSIVLSSCLLRKALGTNNSYNSRPRKPSDTKKPPPSASLKLEYIHHSLFPVVSIVESQS